MESGSCRLGPANSWKQLAGSSVNRVHCERSTAEVHLENVSRSSCVTDDGRRKVMFLVHPSKQHSPTFSMVLERSTAPP